MKTLNAGWSEFPRDVQPEWLDTLAPDDPRAVASRRDLRRINRLMASRMAMGTSLDSILRGSQSIHLVELGAGDGQMLLPIAQRYSRHWPAVSLELLDMQPVVSEKTLRDFQSLGWAASVSRTDVFDWLLLPASREKPIVVIANLFMHHFQRQPLCDLLAGIAARSKAFICCEPRRTAFALMCSRSLGAIGCNDVTRHDAVASVRAGFRDQELTQLWPNTQAWRLQERAVGPFVHRFQASIIDGSQQESRQ